ncbi:MAG: NYN domain-containing protein [Chloroflexota bacterium]|nr:NYN domain-containing protein [Chloroflexota bacterium]
MVEQLSYLLRDREWMLFVDGENFTKRGQAILKAAGVKPEPGTYWQRDTYLWLPLRAARDPFFAAFRSMFLPHSAGGRDARLARRAYFYTSATADEPDSRVHRLALRALGFEPRLFKRQQGRSKAVDIALTTEVLTLASEDRYELAVIFAGDGDYVPLIEAVKRLGQYVVLGFFAESGLSPELQIAADEFVDLGPVLVQSWVNYLEGLERERQTTAPEATPEA